MRLSEVSENWSPAHSAYVALLSLCVLLPTGCAGDEKQGKKTVPSTSPDKVVNRTYRCT